LPSYFKQKEVFIMAEMKSMEAIQEKYTRVTPERRVDYEKGIRAPRRKWKASAKAGVATYKAAMTESIAKDMYNKGLDKVSDADWETPSLEVGPGRFAEGTLKAGPKYAKGYAPIATAIKAVTLQARFPKGDLRNLKNVELVTQAARKAKVGA
jgi:hypothetical protein